MSKVAIVFWSQTGNTEEMANQVKSGAEAAGAEVTVFQASEFNSSKVGDYDVIAFGCPAMGVEVLEEEEFEPMFTEVESSLKDKKVALFGSYDWGDGEWMRTWQARTEAAGAVMVADGVIVNNTPTDASVCEELGKKVAEA